MAKENSNTLIGVQALRGLAAMLVVFAHATQMVHERFGNGVVYHFGASGVDIFFPISGFVMVMTTYHYWGQPGQWREFLLRRIIRIVPLYWAATTLKALATIALPTLTSHPHLDPWHVTASYLFIPAWDADSKALPLLPVGWTLHFEMVFYLLFAIALAFRVRPVVWISLLLLALSLAHSQRPPELGAVATLMDPILMEFAFGMLIGWATVTGRRLPRPIAWVAFPIGLAALVLTQALPESVDFSYRLVLWGIPGALLLLSAVALEAPCRKWFRGLPALLGDASYAIYLGHGFTVPLVGVLFLKLHLTSPIWMLVTVLLACLVSAFAGVAIHLVFESPLTKRLNALRRKYSRTPPTDARPTVASQAGRSQKES